MRKKRQKTVRLSIDGKRIAKEIQLADSFWLRFMGLMGRNSLLPYDGLLLKNCSSIHTFFMKFVIDVVYLSEDFEILAVQTVKPWRLGKIVRGAKHVLELPEGMSDDFIIGKRLEINTGDDGMKDYLEIKDMDDFDTENMSSGDLLAQLRKTVNTRTESEPMPIEPVVEIAQNRDGLISLRSDEDTLDAKLKRNAFGYTKASVTQYINNLNATSEQMQNNLSNQIKSLSLECAKLTSEGAVLREQIAEADLERAKAEEELLNALSGRSEAEKRAAAAEEELQRYAEQGEYGSGDRQLEFFGDGTGYEEIQLAREEAELRAAAAEDELAQLRAALEDGSDFAETKNLRQQLQNAQETAFNQQELLEEYAAEMANLRRQLDEAQETIARQQEELESYASEVEALREQLLSVQEATDGRDSVMAELQTAQQVKASQEQQLQEYAAEAESLRQELQTAQETVSGQEQQLRDNAEELERMHQQLRETQETVFRQEALLSEYAAQEAKARELHSDEAILRMDELEFDNNKLKETADSLKIELLKLRNEKESQNQNYTKLYDQFNRTVNRADALEKERDAISNLLEQYQAKDQKYSMMDKQMEDKKRIIEDQTKTVKTLLSEMESQMQMFNKLLETHEEEKKTICNLLKEREALQVQNVNLRETIEIISRQLSVIGTESLQMSKKINGGVEVEKTKEAAKAPAQDLSAEALEAEEKLAAEAIRKAKELSAAFSAKVLNIEAANY